MSTIEREKTVPEVRPVTTRDVLHRAADLLEEFGWCQGTPYMWDEKGHFSAFCAGGAVIQAQEDLNARIFPVFAISIPDTLRETLGVGLVQGWNDEPGRTKAEVVAKLREAADRA